MTLKKSLFAALVAVSAVTMTASTSSAHLFGRGSCGSWGGGSGGSWGGGSWGSRGSWGSCGSCGGSYGSGGSWGGGSCGSCGGCYTVTSSCGSCGGYSYSGCDSCGGGYSSVSYGNGSYAQTGVVYSNAVVSSVPAVKTRLTLHVPADAKVTLAGVETKQVGEVRQFATSRLSSGQTWDDYKVVIETTRDGKTLREERVLKLTGGQDQDLAVDFKNDSTQQVAQLTR